MNVLFTSSIFMPSGMEKYTSFYQLQFVLIAANVYHGVHILVKLKFCLVVIICARCATLLIILEISTIMTLELILLIFVPKLVRGG